MMILLRAPALPAPHHGDWRQYTGHRRTGRPDHAGFPAAHSLWWTYAAPVNGVVLLDATASSFPASLDVYTGDQLNTLTEITSSSSSPESAVRFQVIAGQTYQIAVDGPDGQTGNINLRLSFAPCLRMTILPTAGG